MALVTTAALAAVLALPGRVTRAAGLDEGDEGVPPLRLRALEGSVRDALAAVAGAVVCLHVTRPDAGAVEEDPSVPRSVRDLVERRTRESLRGRRPEEYQERPSGPISGLVLDGPRGLVACSLYLVDGAGVLVDLVREDGTLVELRRLGTDENKDLALLATARGEVLEAPALEEASDPEVGSTVAVVGRSRSFLRPEVTVGIVSALGRDGGMTGEASNVQVDAAMNYGNLGGAVVDLRGRVVGMAAHVRGTARGGLNSGVGFAVPLAQVRGVLPRLVAGETVGRRVSSPLDPEGAFLGVQFEEAPRPGGGIAVSLVVPGSAAAAAGLEPGDVVLAVDGTEVGSALALGDAIRGREAGDRVGLRLLRAGTILEVEVVLGRRGRH
ncbi:MAG: PDZ domain-containing protein [Planctomycetes bacterium]|nr:PDZ domain-containing protein [Planctomycetota bacterium]